MQESTRRDHQTPGCCGLSLRSTGLALTYLYMVFNTATIIILISLIDYVSNDMQPDETDPTINRETLTAGLVSALVVCVLDFLLSVIAIAGLVKGSQPLLKIWIAGWIVHLVLQALSILTVLVNGATFSFFIMGFFNYALAVYYLMVMKSYLRSLTSNYEECCREIAEEKRSYI